ncbi:hypothetical protein J2W23_001617 [Variovorax boronicumulans]|uniref:hypothetical protein n=1 Tax=Variovorax boronicumulans TaxID=436515 RepID=UPI00277DA9AA|nr:hypothetical protein [Variovorax boronicumulans]MDQ0013238.1 hypothetical protein [Variovorax boronicumulans]
MNDLDTKQLAPATKTIFHFTREAWAALKVASLRTTSFVPLVLLATLAVQRMRIARARPSDIANEKRSLLSKNKSAMGIMQIRAAVGRRLADSSRR